MFGDGSGLDFLDLKRGFVTGDQWYWLPGVGSVNATPPSMRRGAGANTSVIRGIINSMKPINHISWYRYHIDEFGAQATRRAAVGAWDPNWKSHICVSF